MTRGQIINIIKNMGFVIEQLTKPKGKFYYTATRDGLTITENTPMGLLKAIKNIFHD